ncbi:hypothetical protein Tco_0044082, partial [Tanacetum coccineum]
KPMTVGNVASKQGRVRKLNRVTLNGEIQSFIPDFVDFRHPAAKRGLILRRGFPLMWESVGFCRIDASIRGWQGLPSGYVLWNRMLAGTTFWVKYCGIE